VGVVRIALRSLVVAALTYPGLAFLLIVSQSPEDLPRARGLDFSALTAIDRTGLPEMQRIAARDGTPIRYRAYPSAREGAPLLILLHGSGGHGLYFHPLARFLAGQGAAEVVVPDLRGHGLDPVRRGDVDHIGQLEEDIADLIAALAGKGQEVVLGGHSSGGGLVIRFAGGPYGSMIDRALLLAPFLKYNAPTMRPNSGGWAFPLTRRIIGLSMLNAIGIDALNYLTVIQFNLTDPVSVTLDDEATTPAYSYRMNVSLAPRPDYLADIAALPPFLLLVGARDEAFIPDRFEPLMRGVTDKGRYVILPDTGHIDLVTGIAVREPVLKFLTGAGQ